MTAFILTILATILVSFLCSVLEATLMSTPISYLSMREEDGSKSAALLKKYKTDIDRPLASILVLNTIANTMGAAIIGGIAAKLWNSTAVGITSAVMTIMILVFAEIIPKTIGATYWRRLTGFTARMISVLIVITYPFVLAAEWITRKVGGDEDEQTVSREEVSAMANIGEEEGVFEKSENKIIQNIIKLDNIKAFDVMTPRVVAAIAPEKMTLAQFYKDPAFNHHSRIPVYADSPEYITGYILRTEALEMLANDRFKVRLGDIKRDITLFNEEIAISDIWEQLLKNKEQIGLIIDEYGCFTGIITLEDIIETIFGLEIIDEMDEVSDMQQYARERWERRQKRYRQIELPDDDDDDSDDDDDDADEPQPIIMRTDVENKFKGEAEPEHSAEALDGVGLRYGEPEGK
ncbi:MAG: DUF21 domain-containing protein [Bacteroidales bacterium]|nr:DUF21 domain-containing protein [Bacteroidales bacterium]